MPADQKGRRHIYLLSISLCSDLKIAVSRLGRVCSPSSFKCTLSFKTLTHDPGWCPRHAAACLTYWSVLTLDSRIGVANHAYTFYVHVLKSPKSRRQFLPNTWLVLVCYHKSQHRWEMLTAHHRIYPTDHYTMVYGISWDAMLGQGADPYPFGHCLHQWKRDSLHTFRNWYLFSSSLYNWHSWPFINLTWGMWERSQGHPPIAYVIVVISWKSWDSNRLYKARLKV
jgi:hypothetical protein